MVLAASATPRRAPTRIALQARTVAHQREVAAFAAGFAFVALGLGFGAFLGGVRTRLGFGEGELLELFRGRELQLGLGLERGGAGDFGARLAAARERFHVRWSSGTGVCSRPARVGRPTARENRQLV